MSRDSARKAAQRAIPAERCEVCGTTEGKIERHHPDYSQPLNVKILCTTCHAAEERHTGQRKSKAMRECPVCGAHFLYRHSGQRTCARTACLKEIGRRNAEKRWHAHDRTKHCQVCGTTFLPKRQRERSCGKPECLFVLRSTAVRSRRRTDASDLQPWVTP